MGKKVQKSKEASKNTQKHEEKTEKSALKPKKIAQMATEALFLIYVDNNFYFTESEKF